MRDETLWGQIRAAPTALANAEFGLEWVITQRMRQKFELNPERCSIVLYEYRRFRYLCSVSDETLKPPPLLRFVQARDTINSVARNEGKWGQIRSVRDASWETPPFERDPAYQRTLALYQQEFGLEAPPKIWPSPLTMRRRRLAFLPCSLGLGLLSSVICSRFLGSLALVTLYLCWPLPFKCYTNIGLIRPATRQPAFIRRKSMTNSPNGPIRRHPRPK
jgi:hypothetical protein